MAIEPGAYPVKARVEVTLSDGTRVGWYGPALSLSVANDIIEELGRPRLTGGRTVTVEFQKTTPIRRRP